MSSPDFPLPAGYAWQYHWIVWLQGFQSVSFDKAAHWLAWLGIEGAYLLVLPIIFWSIHRRFGLRIGYIVLISMYTNNWLKVAFGVVRPSGIPGIRTLATATGPGYSLPSAHTQETLTFFGSLARALPRWRWTAWLLAFILALLVGLSRVYAGLHWPVDVLLGLVLGAVFSVIGWLVGKWWTYRKYTWSVRLGICIGLGGLLLVVHRGPMAAQYAAWVLGAGLGNLLDERYLGTDIDPVWWRRLCTAVIGMAGLIALQWIIPWPSQATVWLVVRGVLVGSWCALGAPYAFVQCGLYRRANTPRG